MCFFSNPYNVPVTVDTDPKFHTGGCDMMESYVMFTLAGRAKGIILIRKMQATLN